MKSITLEVVVVVGDQFNATATADEIHDLINDAGVVLLVDTVKVVGEGALDTDDR
jgi:hypothetical protein